MVCVGGGRELTNAREMVQNDVEVAALVRVGVGVGARDPAACQTAATTSSTTTASTTLAAMIAVDTVPEGGPKSPER